MACPNCGNTAADTATVCLKRSDTLAILGRGIDGCYTIPVPTIAATVFKDDANVIASVVPGSAGGLKLAGGAGIDTVATSPGGGVDGLVTFSLDATELALGAQGAAGGGSAASRYVGGDNQLHDLPLGGSGLVLATTDPGPIAFNPYVGIGTTAARADHEHKGMTLTQQQVNLGSVQTISSTTPTPVLTQGVIVSIATGIFVVVCSMDINIASAGPIATGTLIVDGSAQTGLIVCGTAGRWTLTMAWVVVGLAAGPRNFALNAHTSSGSYTLNAGGTNMRILSFQ